MQSAKSEQAMEQINIFSHNLYDYLRKCIDWYVHECPSDVVDEVKETYDGLIELYSLIVNVKLRKEWEANPACFYDIVEAYYQQVWIPYKVEWDLTDEEEELAHQFEAIHNEGEVSYGTYDGYAK